MKEAQKKLQELLQMEVQRTTSTNTLKDQVLVKENSKLKVEIATLRKQLQNKESNQGQTEGSTFSQQGEMSKQPRQRKK